jgi:hypothetical protein
MSIKLFRVILPVSSIETAAVFYRVQRLILVASSCGVTTGMKNASSCLLSSPEERSDGLPPFPHPSGVTLHFVVSWNVVFCISAWPSVTVKELGAVPAKRVVKSLELGSVTSNVNV